MIGVIARSTITCDGCGKQLDGGTGYQSATEARAAAFAEGWRFPLRVKADGSPVGSRTNDVCPDCLENWIPQVDRHAAAASRKADARKRACPKCGAAPLVGCTWPGESEPRRWNFMHNERLAA